MEEHTYWQPRYTFLLFLIIFNLKQFLIVYSNDAKHCPTISTPNECQIIWECEASEYIISRSSKIIVQLTWKGGSRTIRDYLKCKLPDYEEYRGPLLRDSPSCLTIDAPNIIIAEDIAQYRMIGVIREPVGRFSSGMATVLSYAPTDNVTYVDDLNALSEYFRNLQTTWNDNRGILVEPSDTSRKCFAKSYSVMPSWMRAYDSFRVAPHDRRNQVNLIRSFLISTLCGERYSSFEGGGSNHMIPFSNFLLSRFVSNGTSTFRPKYDKLIRVENILSDLEEIDKLLSNESRHKQCMVSHIGERLSPVLADFKMRARTVISATPELSKLLCHVYRDDYVFYPLPRFCESQQLPTFRTVAHV